MAGHAFTQKKIRERTGLEHSTAKNNQLESNNRKPDESQNNRPNLR